MQSKYEEINLDVAIERLESNEQEWTHLRLGCITMNTTIGYEMEVSHIHDDDLIKLSKAITNNNTLSHVVIDGTDSTRDLKWTNQGAQAIGEALKNHPNLQFLSINLATFKIKSDEIEGFLIALTGTASIRYFNLEVYCSNDIFHQYLANCLM